MGVPVEKSRVEVALEACGWDARRFRKGFTADSWKRLAYTWEAWARPKQLPPPGDWFTWSLRGGRGFGKTRSGAEHIRSLVESGKARNVALVARTAADVRDTMVEGVSGLLNICPPWFRPEYFPSKRLLRWPNGSEAHCYSADKPGQLRGPQHDAAWADELMAWGRMEETYDMMVMGLRQGASPKLVITSTPIPSKFLRKLEASPDTVVTVGSTYENARNLAKPFLEKLRRDYTGTRLGLQELDAVILDDNPNAIFRMADIATGRIMRQNWVEERKGQRAGETKLAHAYRCGLPRMDAICVSVDPQAESAASGETGIVVSGLTNAWAPEWAAGAQMPRGWVLEDATVSASPAGWAEAVVTAAEEWETDTVVAEINQGGDMVEANIRSHPRGRLLKVVKVRATKNKAVRAGPIGAKYEQHRVHHWGDHRTLELQMTDFDPVLVATTGGKSPDRMDALVWGLTWLMIEKQDAVRAGSIWDVGPSVKRRI